MNMRLIYRSASLSILILASGCAGPSLYTPLPQSHFSYPNSDVSALGPVKGTSKRSFISPFQTPIFNDATMKREAYDDALKGSRGDFIIDGDYKIESTMIPLLFVSIFNVEATVEGTAAQTTNKGNR